MKRKRSFDETTLHEAQGRAMEEQKQRVMSQVPKTAAGFNRDFKALKKDQDEKLAYLKRIPLDTIKGYFNKTELETQTFSDILECLASKLSGADDVAWAHDFMTTLSKSFKFDMTIMFLEDEENENIQKIVTKIREIDAGKADAINEAYTD